MGGGGSKQTIDTINNAISSNILTALQKSQVDLNLSQQIVGKCDTDVLIKISSSYTNCVIDFASKKPVQDVLDICSMHTNICKMSDIDLNVNLNVSDSSLQDDSSKQTVANAIKNTLSQYGGTESDKYIQISNDVLNTTSSKILSDLQSNTDLTQTLQLLNYSGKFITMKSSLKVINNSIQKSDSLQDNITKIANIISQTSENQETTYKSILIMFIIVALSGVIISIIMTLHRSNDIGDFFNRMLPAFIWTILSILVTVIYTLAKPSYVSYIDNTDGKKKIDNKKMFMSMIGYYIAFYLIILIIYKITQKQS